MLHCAACPIRKIRKVGRWQLFFESLQCCLLEIGEVKVSVSGHGWCAVVNWLAACWRGRDFFDIFAYLNRRLLESFPNTYPIIPHSNSRTAGNDELTIVTVRCQRKNNRKCTANFVFHSIHCSASARRNYPQVWLTFAETNLTLSRTFNACPLFPLQAVQIGIMYQEELLSFCTCPPTRLVPLQSTTTHRLVFCPLKFCQ